MTTFLFQTNFEISLFCDYVLALSLLAGAADGGTADAISGLFTLGRKTENYNKK